MPNELAFQTLTVKSVREADGFAFKLTNKFLVGVPDLFIHLPPFGTGIWEVKKATYRNMDTWFEEKLNRQIKVALSGLQNKFLRDFTNRGGMGGVISFVEGRRDDYMAAFPYEVISYGDSTLPRFVTSSLAYSKLERGHRERIIVDVLERAYGRTEV